MMTFDDFRNNHPIGSRIGDDSLVASREETEQTKYQCVSLVKAYIRECYGLQPGAWGNAIHYWTRTAQPLLTKFYQVSNSEAQKGDIVILWGVNDNSLGHIGIATGGLNSTQLEILEQNGQTGNGTGTDHDAIRTRWVARSRVAGLLRPAAVPQPAPNPITQYQPTARKEWLTNKQPTNWWSLNGTTTDINTFQPAAVLNADTPFTVGGYAHHVNGHTYAMTPEDFERASRGDLSTNNGINTADLTERVIPAPYVPPAPPEPIKLAEKYTLVVPCMAFADPTSAMMHKGTAKGLEAGEYYIIAKKDNAYNLSDNNMKDRNQWVNIDDNKELVVVPTPVVIEAQPPVIEPAYTPKPIDLRWYNDSHLPSIFKYKGSIAVPVKNLENPADTLTLPVGAKGPVSRYAMISGSVYLIPDSEFNKGNIYGIPKDLMDEVIARAPLLDRDNDGDIDIHDAADGIQDFIDWSGKYFDGIKQVLVTSKPKIVQAKQRIGKSMDGFNKRRVK